jgi:hypothetical protein
MPRCHVGAVDRIFVTRWHGAPADEDLKRVLDVEMAFARSLPSNGRHGVLVALDAGVSLHLEGSLRNDAALLMRKLSPYVVAMAFVVRDSGPRAAGVRAAMLGLRWMASPRYPLEVERDPRVAVRWMVGELERQGPPVPAGVDQAVVSALSAHEPVATASLSTLSSRLE